MNTLTDQLEVTQQNKQTRNNGIEKNEKNEKAVDCPWRIGSERISDPFTQNAAALAWSSGCEILALARQISLGFLENAHL